MHGNSRAEGEEEEVEEEELIVVEVVEDS